MTDRIFSHPRLVSIYDLFDGPRDDLTHYLSIADELQAKSILDIGCGTGCFACLASSHGHMVTALDPAEASVDLARTKPHSEKVQWIVGDVRVLPEFSVDLAVMTGNVAQVFLTDESWNETLSAIHHVLKPTGHLVFEARDPEKKAWLEWTPELTRRVLAITNGDTVEGWCEVTAVSGEFVTFRWSYTFSSDGQTLTSESTLRFRSKAAIVASLERAGFLLSDIREAPDRPGKEFVFLASPTF